MKIITLMQLITARNEILHWADKPPTQNSYYLVIFKIKLFYNDIKTLTLHYKPPIRAHILKQCFSTFLPNVNRVVALQHKRQSKTCKTQTKKRVSGPISTFRLHLKFPFSVSSPCLNLNETSDFEAVAKLLKVCQWVFASELKDTLRLAKQRGQRGPQHPASQPCHLCTGMFLCVWGRLGTQQTKLRPAKGHHLHCSALNSASGQTQRRYPTLLAPNLPSNRGGVCRRREGGGVQQRWSERWGSGMSLALHNIAQCKQIAPASQQVAFSLGPFHHILYIQ